MPTEEFSYPGKAALCVYTCIYKTDYITSGYDAVLMQFDVGDFVDEICHVSDV